MAPTHSKQDWIVRIEPHLTSSLQTASEEITRTPVVQRWLRDASMEAAEGLGPGSGMQDQMQGYMRMMNRLEERFPELLNAIDDLTEGYGTIDLHWRPTNPIFSRLYIAFDLDYTVKVLVRLSEATPDGARAVLDTVADALPEGSPFPNRPNTVTGLVVFENRGLGLRLSEHLGDDRQRRYRTVTLLPEEHSPLEGLSPDDAVERLLQLLAPGGSSQDT